MAPLFDSHSHINASDFTGDLDEVIARMKTAGLVGAMVVGCDYGEENRILELTAQYPGFLWGAWALHPEYEDRDPVSVEGIIDRCQASCIRAVGETGLDYHWCHGDLTWQKNRFRDHIEAAFALNKPLIIHARDAERDALDILEQTHAGDVGFVLHCFGSDLTTALRAVDAGGLVSFTGVVTFKNAQALQTVAKALPLESMMVETDCPYMAPVPKRGKRNEPAYVEHVARFIAQLKAIPYESVATQTTLNALRFFKIKND